MTSYASDLEIQNKVNRSLCRCTIGKVRVKPRAEENPAYRAAIRELQTLKESIEQSTGKWSESLARFAC